MNFKDAVITCFQKYLDFSGRARRSEFWYFTLFDMIVSFALSFILGESSILPSIFSLAMFIPGLAVSWRRLHDIGKSGGWYFINLIPLVGWIFMLVWCCRDSQPETNIYGENPKMTA